MSEESDYKDRIKIITRAELLTGLIALLMVVMFVLWVLTIGDPTMSSDVAR